MPSIKIILSKTCMIEVKALAKREKRTIAAQAEYMIENSIPALKIRRNSDTDTVDLGIEQEK